MDMGAEGRNATRQGGRKRKRKILFAACVLAALMWSALLWNGLFRLQATPLTPVQPGSPVERKPKSGSTTEKNSTLCTSFLANITTHRFYPQRFFEQGAGRPFLSDYKHNRDNYTDILNARFLVFQPANARVNKADGGCSIVHFHVHKNGGTTLERHVPLPADNYYSKREKALGHEAFEVACTKVMATVWHQQQHLADQPRVRTFTFLRDPVPRFLSSVAQVLKLRVWHKRLYPCYERNSTEALLDCVLDTMESGKIPEMHLSPQSFELYKQVMGNDIFIEVMDLPKIGPVLEQLGAGKIAKERSTTGSLIRRFPNFRLTMDALDPKRIQRICNIYEPDVKMLETTKVTKTICSKSDLVRA